MIYLQVTVLREEGAKRENRGAAIIRSSAGTPVRDRELEKSCEKV